MYSTSLFMNPIEGLTGAEAQRNRDADRDAVKEGRETCVEGPRQGQEVAGTATSTMVARNSVHRTAGRWWTRRSAAR